MSILIKLHKRKGRIVKAHSRRIKSAKRNVTSWSVMKRNNEFNYPAYP